VTGDFCTSSIETGKAERNRKMPKKAFTPEQIVAQLRRAIADLTVERQILKDIAEGNF